MLLDEAINFAIEKHNGQLRKGTNIPYIVHPLSVLSILWQMRADENLLIAGVLHDTLEDTNATEKEIVAKFGNDVLSLVKAHTENKKLKWHERKQIDLESLPNADLRVKKLVLADKLANARDIFTDYKSVGDKLWERFNKPFEEQKWYYNGGVKALESLENVGECKDMYCEFKSLVEQVFA